MACGTLNPRYWPGLAEERHGDAEGGGEDAVVVEDTASLFPPLGTAELNPLIAQPDGGVVDIDVAAMAAAAATPTGETLAPVARGAEDAATSTAGGSGSGHAHTPAAVEHG